MKLNLENHPCFNNKARHTHARVHLPVAPRCNIQCKFCNRKFDCMNESRPGVCSTILKPDQAMVYLKELMAGPRPISVVGIAGPGDPFANPEETMETLRQVRAEYPEMLLCVASNGLNVHPYVEEMAKLQVSHVTLTINAIDPNISKQIYSYIRYNKRTYTGIEAAQILLTNQYKSLKALKAAGITVKINTIVIPGINGNHVVELTKKLAEEGVDIQNIIPVYPVKGTPFEHIEAPSKEVMAELRSMTSEILPQMRHCARCRADAVGLIGEKLTIADLELLAKSACSSGGCAAPKPEPKRPYVAVGSLEGVLVNQHLGDADELLIYSEGTEGFKLKEVRKTPERGSGDKRWSDLGSLLKDCRSILVSGVGSNPSKILAEMGIKIDVMEGLIEDGLDAVFNNKPLRAPLRQNRCGEGCSGDGMGCG